MLLVDVTLHIAQGCTSSTGRFDGFEHPGVDGHAASVRLPSGRGAQPGGSAVERTGSAPLGRSAVRLLLAARKLPPRDLGIHLDDLHRAGANAGVAPHAPLW